MKIEDLLVKLEETVASLNITLEYDDLKKGVVNSLGGFFTHNGKGRILVHKSLSTQERIEVLVGIIADLEELDFSSLDLPEDILESIEAEREKRDRLIEEFNAEPLEVQDSPAV